MSFSEKALAAYQNGDLTQAKKLVQQALQQDSDDELFDLAESLTAAGITTESQKIYQSLLKKYPQEDILKVNLAEILISDDQIDRATDLLNQVQPTSSAYLSALLVSADLYQTLGLYEVSEQKLLTALRLAPDEEVIQFALAELYFVEKKYSQAATFYEKLIKQGYQEFSGCSLTQRLAAVYAGAGQYEQAETMYQQMSLASLNAESLANYATVEVELKNYPAAQKIIAELLASNPDYSPGYVLAVQIAEHQKDYQSALKQAQLGIGYDPFNGRLYQLAAEAAVKLNDVPQAVSLLQKGIERVEENTDLILDCSNLLLQDQQYQDNRDLLTEHKEQLNDEPLYHWNLARSLEELDQIPQALQEMLSVYQHYQNNAAYLKDLIQILRQGSQKQLLLTAVKRYLQLVPDDQDIIELEQELGDWNEN